MRSTVNLDLIGWSMQSRMTKDIVLNALLMAVWRRNPEKQMLVHSDQGSQYTSVGMVLANRCHRQNMKTSIINGSEVSRLSVAIHFLLPEIP